MTSCKYIRWSNLQHTRLDRPFDRRAVVDSEPIPVHYMKGSYLWWHRTRPLVSLAITLFSGWDIFILLTPGTGRTKETLLTSINFIVASIQILRTSESFSFVLAKEKCFSSIAFPERLKRFLVYFMSLTHPEAKLIIWFFVVEWET